MSRFEKIKKKENNENEVAEELERLKNENAELKALIEQLKKDAIHDKLTGLKTRDFLMTKLNDDVEVISGPERKAERRKKKFETLSVLFCDIDFFKEANDNHGHDFGDKILKEVGELLEANVRESDTVCRWGGDEMVISLSGANEREATQKAEQLRKKIEELVEKYKEDPAYSDFKISLSIGVSEFKNGLSAEELTERGDRAMYLAKEEKNCVRTYSEVLEREQKE